MAPAVAATTPPQGKAGAYGIAPASTSVADGARHGRDAAGALPGLRVDLEVLPGPSTADGAPTWTIRDPLRRRYYQVGWVEGLALQGLRYASDLDDWQAWLARRAPGGVERAALTRFLEQAAARRLLDAPPVRDTPTLLRMARGVPWTWRLLRSYLYIRLPLLRADGFLERALPWVRPLASRAALLSYAGAFLLGLLLLLPRWDQFLGAIAGQWRWQGLASFLLALIAVKVVHEFAHAFTAKAFGLHVPTMGVALMVLWPVAYTDVTDAWALRDRRRRIAISAAGVAAEVAVAGVALLGWSLMPPGPGRGICLHLSVASLISTLLVNLSPAMRFDGYYVLMDLWGIDNLHRQAANALRLTLWRGPFGMETPLPARLRSWRRRTALCLFGLYATLYRIALYFGIALLVYRSVTKSLGILLFVTEMVMFLGLPAAREGASLLRMRGRIRAWWRPLATGILALLAILYLALPLPRRMQAPAVVAPANEQVLYAPRAGILRIESIPRNDPRDEERRPWVEPGTPLFRVEPLAYAEQLAGATADYQAALARVEGIAHAPERAAELQPARQRLAEADRALQAVRARAATVTARIGGRLVAWDERLRSGMAVRERAVLGRVVGPRRVVVAMTPESEASMWATRRTARFRSTTGRSLPLGEATLARRASTRLPYAALARAHGGPIAATPVGATDPGVMDGAVGGGMPPGPGRSGSPDSEPLRMAEPHAIYRFQVREAASRGDMESSGTAVLDESAPRVGERGAVHAWSPPRSLLLEWARWLHHALLRESAF